MDTQGLLPQCFFLLAVVSKISDLLRVPLLIYFISLGMVLFSSFQPSWEMIFPPTFYFLLNLGSFSSLIPTHILFFPFFVAAC